MVHNFYGDDKGGIKHSTKKVDSSTALCQLSSWYKHSASIPNPYLAEPKLSIPTFQIALVYFKNMSTKANLYTIFTEINCVFISQQCCKIHMSLRLLLSGCY